jgi:hypothetical protein
MSLKESVRSEQDRITNGGLIEMESYKKNRNAYQTAIPIMGEVTPLYKANA